MPVIEMYRNLNWFYVSTNRDEKERFTSFRLNMLIRDGCRRVCGNFSLKNLITNRVFTGHRFINAVSNLSGIVRIITAADDTSEKGLRTLQWLYCRSYPHINFCNCAVQHPATKAGMSLRGCWPRRALCT
jgi:hypothetical protein